MISSSLDKNVVSFTSLCEGFMGLAVYLLALYVMWS